MIWYDYLFFFFLVHYGNKRKMEQSFNQIMFEINAGNVGRLIFFLNDWVFFFLIPNVHNKMQSRGIFLFVFENIFGQLVN